VRGLAVRRARQRGDRRGPKPSERAF
jgi:hypothetical protein